VEVVISRYFLSPSKGVGVNGRGPRRRRRIYGLLHRLNIKIGIKVTVPFVRMYAMRNL
jgi:hypothetical protein